MDPRRRTVTDKFEPRDDEAIPCWRQQDEDIPMPRRWIDYPLLASAGVNTDNSWDRFLADGIIECAHPNQVGKNPYCIACCKFGTESHFESPQHASGLWKWRHPPSYTDYHRIARAINYLRWPEGRVAIEKMCQGVFCRGALVTVFNECLEEHEAWEKKEAAKWQLNGWKQLNAGPPPGAWASASVATGSQARASWQCGSWQPAPPPHPPPGFQAPVPRSSSNPGEDEAKLETRNQLATAYAGKVMTRLDEYEVASMARHTACEVRCMKLEHQLANVTAELESVAARLEKAKSCEERCMKLELQLGLVTGRLERMSASLMKLDAL